MYFLERFFALEEKDQLATHASVAFNQCQDYEDEAFLSGFMGKYFEMEADASVRDVLVSLLIAESQSPNSRTARLLWLALALAERYDDLQAFAEATHAEPLEDFNVELLTDAIQQRGSIREVFNLNCREVYQLLRGAFSCGGDFAIVTELASMAKYFDRATLTDDALTPSEALELFQHAREARRVLGHMMVRHPEVRHHLKQSVANNVVQNLLDSVERTSTHSKS